MPAPTSYAGPRRDEGKRKTTYSQTVTTNQSNGLGKVAQILEQKGNAIFSVRPDDSMGKAVDILREKRIGALIVTSESGKLEGILSERDIVRKLSETPGRVLEQKVEVLMTRKVKTVTPDETLVSVLKQMTEGRFRHMPVMQNNALVGMITIGDVVNFRLRELEYEAVQLKQIIVG
ncbi:MAG: CBS domain-containing protein [Pseudomonadota bacterium]